MGHLPTPTLPPIAPAQSLDDEIIPTAIVIKNIPFNVKRESLLELIVRADSHHNTPCASQFFSPPGIAIDSNALCLQLSLGSAGCFPWLGLRQFPPVCRCGRRCCCSERFRRSGPKITRGIQKGSSSRRKGAHRKRKGHSPHALHATREGATAGQHCSNSCLSAV